MRLFVCLVGVLALTGCTDDLITAETGETETGETGEPMPECDEPPRVFGEPVGMWFEPSPGVFGLDRPAIASGGDLVWIDPLTLGRWDRNGQPRWEHPTIDNTYYSEVGITAAGQIVVIGETQQEDSQLTIARFDSDGVLLGQASFEHSPGANESVFRAAVSPRGDVLTEIRLRDLPDDQPQYQLVYIDSELQQRWIASPTHRLHMGLGFGPDDRSYGLYIGFAQAPPDGLPPATVAWPIKLSAYDDEGNELWAIADELLAQTNPRLQLAIGDRVYMYFNDPHFVMGSTDSLIRAHDFDGSLIWELGLDYEVEIHAIAASPCGGLYVAGLADDPEGVPSMAIWSLDPDGERGPFTRVPLQDDVFIDAVLVSPLDEVVIHGSDGAGTTDWMLGW